MSIGIETLKTLKMKLEKLGFDEGSEQYRSSSGISRAHTGRIIAAHRERYSVMTESGEYVAAITGNSRFSAASAEDYPAVGDWVALSACEDRSAIINLIFPRRTLMMRHEAGKRSTDQVMAANVDSAFIIQSADRDLSMNRLERYLTLCHSSEVRPLILISKTDLLREGQSASLLQRIETRMKVPVLGFSNQSGSGLVAIRSILEAGKTYCMLGSSGVGKSTLINHLSGRSAMKTGNINIRTGRGRHITSHRQLILLDGGSILIDTPGMREVGIGEGSGGLGITFGPVEHFSQQCRFRDCTHTTEQGCAVKVAVMSGAVDRASYENYLKLVREKEHFDRSVAERRRKEKEFGKMMKNYKRDMKRNRPDQ